MDENPKENMEKAAEDDESSIRQRIIMAVRQKAGLPGSEAGIEAKVNDPQVSEAETDHASSGQAEAGGETKDASPDQPKFRAPLRFWNSMDDENDPDYDIAYGGAKAAHARHSGADEVTRRNGIAGRAADAHRAQDASGPNHAMPPGPLNDAIRHRTIGLEPLHRVRNPYVKQLSQLDPVLRGDARLARPAPPNIQNGEAAQLLEGLIAECHFLMRELVLPSAMESADPDERRRFLSTAMELAQTGATVAKTVAKLRRGAPPSTASRITKEEHIQISP